MSLLGQPRSYNVEKLSASYHKDIPTDGRFTGIRQEWKTPVDKLDEKGGLFKFPASPWIWLIDQLRVEIGVSLVTKMTPHAKPASGTAVGVVNNVLHSLIKEVKIRIGDIPSKCTLF